MRASLLFGERMLRCSAAFALAGSRHGSLNAASSPPQKSSSEPLFRFGLIADIQYCDCDDAANFAGTEVRGYRGTLHQAHEAVKVWNEHEVAFVAQLGDLIDGQNAGSYGAGLSFTEPQSDIALGRVLGALSACRAPIYHAVGNHELYNFDWAGLSQRLRRPGWHIVHANAPQNSATAEDFFFSWRVDGCDYTGHGGAKGGIHPGWTFIMLNAYCESVEQDPCLPGYRAAVATLAENNPKCFDAIMSGLTQGIDFFDGIVEDSKLRYVPFNGGAGERQREWLRHEVIAAVERGDHIVVMSHLPMLPEASSHRTLMYDAEAVMRILREDGHGHVVACVAGHLHRGGYAVDSAGIHHVTLQSPLNFERCFALVDVYTDRLELVGFGGGIPSRTLVLPEQSNGSFSSC